MSTAQSQQRQPSSVDLPCLLASWCTNSNQLTSSHSALSYTWIALSNSCFVYYYYYYYHFNQYLFYFFITHAEENQIKNSAPLSADTISHCILACMYGYFPHRISKKYKQPFSRLNWGSSAQEPQTMQNSEICTKLDALPTRGSDVQTERSHRTSHRRTVLSSAPDTTVEEDSDRTSQTRPL